jgi:hypothetical protein
VKLYFTVIGLAFFLPKDVSLSLGVGPVLYYLLAGVLAGFGISMTNRGFGWYTADLRHSLQAGAYFGMLVVIIYTGRHYYKNVLLSTFGFTSSDPVGPQAKWGARAFLASLLVIVALLVGAGLDWQLALVFTVLVFGIFLVIGRISAESGYIFIQPYWEPAAFIVGLLGFRAIGPSTALIMFIASTVLLVDTREPLTPFAFNSFKVLGGRDVPLTRAAGLGVLALVVGMAVAIPVTMRIKYERGTDRGYWAARSVPRFAFDATVRIKQRLRAQGELENAESISGFARLKAFSPSTTLLIGFFAALGLFLVLSALRLRLPGWPLHPILLLIWGVAPATRYVGSFLIGCLIKWAVVKYGGDKAYRQAKPLMIGLIAADMLMGVTTGIIGGIYYSITGEPPPRFATLVG